MYENLVLDQNNLYLISFNILIICLLFNISMDILGRNYIFIISGSYSLITIYWTNEWLIW